MFQARPGAGQLQPGVFPNKKANKNRYNFHAILMTQPRINEKDDTEK